MAWVALVPCVAFAVAFFVGLVFIWSLCGGSPNDAWQEVSVAYWTADAEEIVWEFYRRELPDWPRNLDESTGKELIHWEPEGVRLIRVTRQKERDRTVIETCIKPPGYPHRFSGRGYR